MTRVNCVPVQELTKEHLIAEYKELPRIAKLALSRFEKDPNYQPPPTYRLNKGHMLFFVDKGGWLAKRHKELVTEMISRGYNVNFPEYPIHVHPKSWMGNWDPTPEAIAISRERIHLRLQEAYNRRV